MSKSYARVMNRLWMAVVEDAEREKALARTESARLRALLARAVHALDNTEELDQAELAHELAAAGAIPLEPA